MKKNGRNERLVITVEEMAKLLGLGRASAYEAVRRGDVPSVRVGRRILIPRRALERLLMADGTQLRSNSAEGAGEVGQ